MKDDLQDIVNAILYEGYILYPYRASSSKNQRERFTFGRIYPEFYCQKQNNCEPYKIQTEILLETGNDLPELHISLGFLQPIQREICVLPQPLQTVPSDEGLYFNVVPKLEVNGKSYQTWMEASERQIKIPFKTMQGSVEALFSFEAQCFKESIFDENGLVVAVIRRLQSPVSGRVLVKSHFLKHGLFKISVVVLNQSPVEESNVNNPDKILMSTLASSHVIFKAKHGRFISLLETPAELNYFAVQCRNTGVWPVLVGDKSRGDCSTMLASPIILYDYPQVSPESAANFCDGTEIDEMLHLRVLAMTDAEKREMQADDFARRILERTQALDGESFLKLHGRMRETHPANEEYFNPVEPVKSALIDGIELHAGDKVWIRPSHCADAMDLMLAGRIAVIETLEQDVEGQIHLALVVVDDPGSDLGMDRQSGHRFFYRADEVEPCRLEASS